MAKGKELSLNGIKRLIALSDNFENMQLGKVSPRPYKTYAALLTQTGTAAPVATVMENGIGAIVIARTGVGVYTMTLTGAFTTGKTAVNISHMGAGKVTAALTSANVITISTVDATPVAADAILNGTLVEVRVYN